MDRGAWKKPVALEMYGRPGIVRVADTLEAALLLLGGWYSRRTDAHAAAVLTCRDVLKGKAQPGLARAVFIDAVPDAGYHILPETFLDERWSLPPMIDEKIEKDPFRREASAVSLSPGSPAVSRRQSVHPRLVSERNRIPDLLADLGATLGLISVEIIRSIASLVNNALRRPPDRQIR